MLDTDPSITDGEKPNSLPPTIQYLSEAITDWPPLFSVEDDGRRDHYRYAALRLDLVTDEYYPFSDLQRRLIKADIAAEVVGIDTTSENDLPRLILEIDTKKTDIDFSATDFYCYYEPRHRGEMPMHKVIHEGCAYYFEEKKDDSLQMVQHTDESGTLVSELQDINERGIADDIVAVLEENGVANPIRF